MDSKETLYDMIKISHDVDCVLETNISSFLEKNCLGLLLNDNYTIEETSELESKTGIIAEMIISPILYLISDIKKM